MKNIFAIIMIASLPLCLFSKEQDQTAVIKRRSKTNWVQKDSNTKTVYSKSENVQKLLEQGKKIEELLKRKTDTPFIWDESSQILTGSVFKGVLLNSIHSTNLSSPVLVRSQDSRLPYNAKFSCQAITQINRVQIICNLMIANSNEQKVAVQILNPDGSAGIIGEFDDGKEDLIAGAIVSDFAQGVLSASQTKVLTPFGNTNDVTIKNQVLGGLMESGKTASDIMLEESKNAQPVVSIDAGTPVLIYFMEALNGTNI